MEKYEEVVLEVIQFESEDIICNSCTSFDSGNNEFPDLCLIVNCPTNT